MIGVVVVTHGQLATELVNAAETIVGDLPQFTAVSIGWHDDTQDAREEIAQAVARVGTDAQGVLILTDMFGGTPANLAMTFLAGNHVEVITGVNLPMLLRAVTYRHDSLDAQVQRAIAGGSAGVMQVAVAAPQNQVRRAFSDQDIRDHQQ